MRFHRSVQVLFLGAVLCFMSLGCTQGNSAKIIPPPRITLAAGEKITVAQAGGGPTKKAPVKEKEKDKDKEKVPDGKPDSSAKPGDKPSSGQDGNKKPEKP